MMIAAVLMALAWQDAEIDRLRDEIAKLRAENEALRKSVESARTPKAAPRSIEAKVTAVSSEIGLVVLSARREDGVADGDEFAVVRDGKFVAAVVVDRVDRRWSAARVKAALDTPRVGDNASTAPREDVRVRALFERELALLRRELAATSPRAADGAPR